MKALSLIVGVSGLLITLAPIHPGYKVITSFTASVTCFNLAIAQGKINKKTKAEQIKKQQDLDFGLLDLTNKQHILEQDLEAIAALRQELTFEKETLADLIKATEDISIAEIAAREKEANTAIKSARQKAAIQIWMVKSRAWRDRKKWVAEMTENFNHEVGDLTDVAMSALNRAQGKLQAKSALLEGEEISNAATGLEGLRTAFLQGHEAIAQYKEAAIKDMADDLAAGQEFLGNLAESQKKQIEQATSSVLGHSLTVALTQCASKSEEAEALREQIYQLQGQLEAIAKPYFCPHKNRAGEKANDFIRYANDALRIKLVWIASKFIANDCLVMDFKFHDAEDKSKAIAKLQKKQVIEAICVEFGSEGVIIQPNPVDHCWSATIPANEGYQGDDEVYQVSDIADDLEGKLRQQMNLQQTEDFMMRFTPVVPIHPDLDRKEPSKQEWITLNYFFFWRLEAEGKANIVTIAGLLREVYGMSEEQGKAINPRTRESLCDRLERFLPQLKTEYAQLVQGVTWD